MKFSSLVASAAWAVSSAACAAAAAAAATARMADRVDGAITVTAIEAAQ